MIVEIIILVLIDLHFLLLIFGEDQVVIVALLPWQFSECIFTVQSLEVIFDLSVTKPQQLLIYLQTSRVLFYQFV